MPMPFNYNQNDITLYYCVCAFNGQMDSSLKPNWIELSLNKSPQLLIPSANAGQHQPKPFLNNNKFHAKFSYKYLCKASTANYFQYIQCECMGSRFANFGHFVPLYTETDMPLFTFIHITILCVCGNLWIFAHMRSIIFAHNSKTE